MRVSAAGRVAMAWRWAREGGLDSRVTAGLLVDAALDATENWTAEEVDTPRKGSRI
ncbi:hypothetical protein ACFV6G_25200 [Streptomyces lavendulae]|uniref:hypothetical protein n=1 Tax=Streptomyces lavendulae TaxID=1914 RepID=UPI0036937C75